MPRLGPFWLRLGPFRGRFRCFFHAFWVRSGGVLVGLLGPLWSLEGLRWSGPFLCLCLPPLAFVCPLPRMRAVL